MPIEFGNVELTIVLPYMPASYTSKTVPSHLGDICIKLCLLIFNNLQKITLTKIQNAEKSFFAVEL